MGAHSCHSAIWSPYCRFRVRDTLQGCGIETNSVTLDKSLFRELARKAVNICDLSLHHCTCPLLRRLDPPVDPLSKLTVVDHPDPKGVFLVEDQGMGRAVADRPFHRRRQSRRAIKVAVEKGAGACPDRAQDLGFCRATSHGVAVGATKRSNIMKVPADTPAARFSTRGALGSLEDSMKFEEEAFAAFFDWRRLPTAGSEMECARHRRRHEARRLK